ncbi:MAG: hypothetical protein ACLFWF_07880 [Alphaproteobacteria bacterium]
MIVRMPMAAICAACFLLPFQAQARITKIAVCGKSTGHGYYADRNVAGPQDLGWTEEEMTARGFTLVLNEGGTGLLDLVFPEKDGKPSSYVASGGTLRPIKISENAITIVAVKPEHAISETYVFQKLRSGKSQVMWTETKGDTALPKVGAFVASCEHLDLSAIQE